MNSPTSPMGLFSVINFLMLFLSGKANDVFLSFNLEEIGKNFADHLYKDLNYAGIRTFRDDGGIYTGQKSDIKRAIQESRISVVVFSKDYASSTKCLDQLVLIMDARKTTGLFVLPVFYNVNPSEVRKQKGLFEEAFAKHEKSFHKEMARVESWRAALKEAADLKGTERKQDRGIEFDENERNLAIYKRNEDIEETLLDISKISFESKLNSRVFARKSKLRLLRIYNSGVKNKCKVHLPHGWRQVPFLGDEISALG